MSVKISVIIPTYNRSEQVGRAIESVLNQVWQDLELLIVDDGSTDGTESRVLGAVKDPRVRFFRTDNCGVSAARNFAIKESKGEWLAFLDSDDLWLPEKLKLQMEMVDQHPQLQWIHGEEIWIRNGRRVNPQKKHKKSGGDIFFDALKLCCVSPSTVMIRRSVMSEVGFFREDFPVCEDYELWLKISRRHAIGYIEQPLIKKFGGHQDQLSRRFFAMDYWRILALESLLSESLTNLQRAGAQAELLKKSEILLQGYRKHSNLRHFDQVYNIYHRTKANI